MKNFVLEKIYPQHGAVAVVKEGNFSIFQTSGNEEEFEIGSLTKLFTAELIAEHIRARNIRLDDTIDTFFRVPSNSYVPTIKDLLTHFSGYQKDYFELIPVVKCMLHLDKYVINTKSVICSRIRSEKLTTPTRYLYSNFGYAILGIILEELNSKRYADIVLDYTHRLGMEHTRINTSYSGRLWDWNENDCFISAGGITSTISDMVKFSQHLLLNNSEFCSYNILRPLNNSSNMAVGMSWRIRDDNTAYHTGCTANFNSYISINKSLQKSVIVLLNSSLDKELSAEYIGGLIELKIL